MARREGISKTLVYGADLFHTMLHVSKESFRLQFQFCADSSYLQKLCADP